MYATFESNDMNGRYNTAFFFLWKGNCHWTALQPSCQKSNSRFGQIDSALQEELQKISPVYTTYTLTDGDLNWVGKVPSKPGEMARLKRILYRSALDYVAERYHADPAGCIRLANWDAARVVNQVTMGMTVEIY